jgi:hypothetical protein
MNLLNTRVFHIAFTKVIFHVLILIGVLSGNVLAEQIKNTAANNEASLASRQAEAALYKLRAGREPKDTYLETLHKLGATDDPKLWQVVFEYLILIENYIGAWDWLHSNVAIGKKDKIFDSIALLIRGGNELRVYVSQELSASYVKQLKDFSSKGDDEATVLLAQLMLRWNDAQDELQRLLPNLEKVALREKENSTVFMARAMLNGEGFGPKFYLQYYVWLSRAALVCRGCRVITTTHLDGINKERNPAYASLSLHLIRRQWTDRSERKALLDRFEDNSDLVLSSFQSNLAELQKNAEELLYKNFHDEDPISPFEILNYAWDMFVGEKGYIDESIAQTFTEEGLKFALRAGRKGLVAVARNNLGAILINSSNKNIQNTRLGKIHIQDGSESVFGPENLLSAYFIDKSVDLSQSELEDLYKRYREVAGEHHWSVKIGTELNNLSGQTTLQKIDSILEISNRHNLPRLLIEAAYLCEKELSVCGVDRNLWLWTKSSTSGQFDENDARRLHRAKLLKSGSVYLGPPRNGINIFQIFGRYYFPTGHRPQFDHEFLPYSIAKDSAVHQLKLQASKSPVLNATRAKSIVSAGASFDQTNHISNNSAPQILRKAALVIGNQQYTMAKLATPRSDAMAVADLLKGLGFEVDLNLDLTRSSFIDALKRFRNKADDSAITVFFFAGHGVQVGGQNFALPIDADVSSTAESALFDAIDLNNVIHRFIPGTTRVVFLDACRVAPYASAVRSQSAGLAPVNAPRGTLISFSTRDGGVALDRVGSANLSPFTESLVRNLPRQEDIALILRRVRDEVYRATNGIQEPWDYSNLSSGSVILSAR